MKREVVAKIRLDALRHNLRVVRRCCPRSGVIAMVKANAYGHGLVPVAQALADADAFGVAVIDEALALRAGGVAKPIVIFAGVFSLPELREAAARGFAVVVHHPEQIALLRQAQLAQPLDIWLKLETGMHRLGLAQAVADAAVMDLKGCARTLGVMTHFACADEPANPLTQAQLQALLAFARQHALPASAANSGAIVAMPAAHLDSVRPGIMLYGGAPIAAQQAHEYDLQPVMTLSARVIAINDVPKGEGVGYGTIWHAPAAARVGVVGIGYGDGYPRHAAQGTPVRIGTQLVPLIGRVSMDMITVDLTAHPAVRIGDEVVLWGEGLAADIIARHADTISYELFCRLTSRVHFDYLP